MVKYIYLVLHARLIHTFLFGEVMRTQEKIPTGTKKPSGVIVNYSRARKVHRKLQSAFSHCLYKICIV